MQTYSWVRLLVYVAGLVNQRLLLQCEYLAAENGVLQVHDLRCRMTQAAPGIRARDAIARKFSDGHAGADANVELAAQRVHHDTAPVSHFHKPFELLAWILGCHVQFDARKASWRFGDRAGDFRPDFGDVGLAGIDRGEQVAHEATADRG